MTQWILRLKRLMHSSKQMSEQWLKHHGSTQDDRNTFEGVSWRWPVNKTTNTPPQTKR